MAADRSVGHSSLQAQAARHTSPTFEMSPCSPADDQEHQNPTSQGEGPSSAWAPSEPREVAAPSSSVLRHAALLQLFAQAFAYAQPLAASDVNYFIVCRAIVICHACEEGREMLAQGKLDKAEDAYAKCSFQGRIIMAMH